MERGAEGNDEVRPVDVTVAFFCYVSLVSTDCLVDAGPENIVSVITANRLP